MYISKYSDLFEPTEFLDREIEKYMEMALSLSKRNLGNTAPNPSVGCVIEKDGIVVGRGWTAIGGRPHAETIALEQAGEKAKGANLFVTMEPCCYEGETPPCVDAIIKAGIKKVYLAMLDPNPKVNGKGIARLKKNDIEVFPLIGEMEAEDINMGFVLAQTENRPLVALKFATSIDGKIALPDGESRWITNRAARHYGHFLRSRYDAIMVGIGTVLADDPMLNCRIKGLEHTSPIRIVMDTDLKIPLESKLVKSAKEFPLWVFTSSKDNEKIEKLKTLGVKIFISVMEPISFILTKLVKNGITRLLVEGGATLATSFVKENICDEIYWFTSMKIMGADSIPAIKELELIRMRSSDRYERVETKFFGCSNNDNVMIKICQKL